MLIMLIDHHIFYICIELLYSVSQVRTTEMKKGKISVFSCIEQRNDLHNPIRCSLLMDICMDLASLRDDDNSIVLEICLGKSKSSVGSCAAWYQIVKEEEP